MELSLTRNERQKGRKWRGSCRAPVARAGGVAARARRLARLHNIIADRGTVRTLYVRRVCGTCCCKWLWLQVAAHPWPCGRAPMPLRPRALWRNKCKNDQQGKERVREGRGGYDRGPNPYSHTHSLAQLACFRRTPSTHGLFDFHFS